MSQTNPRFRQPKPRPVDERLVRAFLAAIEQQLAVSGLVIFGSRARGDALESSDYDIAVISDDFAGMPRHERTLMLLDAWPGDVPLEPVAYTTQEFQRASGLLILDILEEGIVFKDTGVVATRRALHERQKQTGEIEKVEEGWKLAK